MLNVDVSHKVLRTDSVLDNLYLIWQQTNQNVERFRDVAAKTLVGEVVLTR